MAEMSDKDLARLTLHEVRKSFGAVEVLHGVSLDVEGGEFVVLVGPSGCGKSTLLRLIAGLEDLTSGEIRLGGSLLNDVEPKDRDMAMVFQNYALYPHLTVRQNMAFSLALRRHPKEDTNRKVDEAARVLGLEAVLERRPSQLSGGQRQRVAMGRAIVRQPRVYLFDEPLSNLDAKLRVRMRGEIKQMHQRFKTTTVYVTHDQIEAMTMADRVVVMKDGYIEQQGRPLDLFDYPANVFVAQFIGSPAMNILSGTMTEGGFRLDSGDVLPADTSKGNARYIGIRPEHVMIGSGPTELVTEVIEPTGTETYIAGKIGNRDFAVSTSERISAEIGHRLALTLPGDFIHFFDADQMRI